MKKARYTTGLVILILLASLIQWPTIKAIVPQDQTISIVETHDDAFITESGNLIDSQLCAILDPGMDIRSFLVFRNVKVNNWEPLKNATLRLRTTVNLDFDNESKVTIYGMRYSELQDISIIRPDFVLSVPLTSAHVNVNTSQFYGQQWHEVNVTNIVEELIRSINWDGDGHAGTETGDAIGFVIFGAEGYDTRWFIDYRYGSPSLAPQLVIHWNHEPPPPAGIPEGSEFNGTRGNYTIWKLSTSNLLDMAYWDGSNEQYMEINANTSDVEISEVTSQGNMPHSYQIIRGPENDIFYLGSIGSNKTLFHSFDEGETWNSYVINDQYANMIGNSNRDGSLAFDTSGDLWIVWASESTTASYERVHSTTVSIADHVLTFAGSSIAIPFQTARPHNRPCIWIGSDDRKHLVWDCYSTTMNFNQVFYAYKDDAGWTGSFMVTNNGAAHTQESQVVTSLNGTFIMITYLSKTSNDAHYAYYKTEWVRFGNLDSWDNNFGLVMSYNDNEDKVLFTFSHLGELSSKIFNFSDLSLSSRYDTGIDGYYPDLTFDVNSNQALMVYDAGADGIQGIIYHFNNESWGTNFTIRDVNPGYIHTVSLATIDIEGKGAPLEEWYVHETDVCTVTGPFEDYNSTTDWIDTEKPDPEDPDPPGWPETGYFTRFSTRLYFLILGFGCLFGPVLFFAWRRPSGYYILCGAIVMLIGIGMLISIGQV